MRELFTLQSNLQETFYDVIDAPFLTYEIKCKSAEAAEQVARLIEGWQQGDEWDGKSASATANDIHHAVVELRVYNIETANRMLCDLRNQIQEVNPMPSGQKWTDRVTHSNGNAKSVP